MRAVLASWSVGASVRVGLQVQPLAAAAAAPAGVLVATTEAH